MSLFKKLLEIQKGVDNLAKDSTAGVGSFAYKYVSGDVVLSYIRPKMNELGILLKQEITGISNTTMNYKNSKGYEKTEVLTTAMQKFTWIDVETGEREECLFGANGQNEFEKGLGSALTYAERYFLLKFFHIPTDELDPDNAKNNKNVQSGYRPQNSQQSAQNNNSAQPTKEWLTNENFTKAKALSKDELFKILKKYDNKTQTRAGKVYCMKNEQRAQLESLLATK